MAQQLGFGNVTLKGQPLAGVTVTAYNTNTSTITQVTTTDESGNYLLQLPAAVSTSGSPWTHLHQGQGRRTVLLDEKGQSVGKDGAFDGFPPEHVEQAQIGGGKRGLGWHEIQTGPADSAPGGRRRG